MESSNKTFFIIPGFKQKATGRSFTWLVKYLDGRGFRVVPVSIEWDRRVMSDYIDDFRRCYERNKGVINYALGFSYGAVALLSSAQRLSLDKIFLCSLSPEFAEDISVMKPWIQKITGKKRLTDSTTRNGKTIARNLTIPSVVFYGEKEGEQYPQLKVRCEETVRLAKNSKLIIVPVSPHKIDYPEYQKALLAELEKL